MYLTQLTVVNFKNYEQAQLTFSPQLNCLVGLNGMGKTNLLDAIYYLCMGKSYTSLHDQYLTRQGAEFFRLDGAFALAEQRAPQRVVVKVQPRQRKEIEHNGNLYARLMEHVGRFPVVIITPDDTLLATEGSEERRRLLDNTLSQMDAHYLAQLVQYNQVLRQRNALLKQLEGRPAPAGLLEVYDQQLEAPARYIFQTREAFVADFGPRLEAAYAAISGGREPVQLTYRSALRDTELPELLRRHLDQDRALQRTTAGIHRDDLTFSLAGRPVKRMASQGQLKSYVLALKLAQYQAISRHKGTPPLLLLDDIFDKLDPSRVTQLLGYILGEAYGQVFISDTDPARVQALLDHFATDYRLYEIDHGTAHLRP